MKCFAYGDKNPGKNPPCVPSSFDSFVVSFFAGLLPVYGGCGGLFGRWWIFCSQRDEKCASFWNAIGQFFPASRGEAERLAALQSHEDQGPGQIGSKHSLAGLHQQHPQLWDNTSELVDMALNATGDTCFLSEAEGRSKLVNLHWVSSLWLFADKRVFLHFWSHTFFAQVCWVLMQKLSADKKGGRYCMSTFFLRGYLWSGQNGSK